MMGRRGQGGEVGQDSGKWFEGEVLSDIRSVSCTREKGLGIAVAHSRMMERTAFWAAGLFCTAVPITHNACTFMSSEEEASKSCNGSHMPSFSRSLIETG